MPIFKRKICVVTGTRAEYGLLRHLIKAIDNSSEFELQLIATGTHLSELFGYTYKEIEADGITIDCTVDIELVGDTSRDIARSTALGITGFSEAYEKLKPDLVVVLGDRFEILSASISAMLARIPIAHLHGGEVTEGAMDEGIRHSITKFSQLHFVANEEYRNRVIQLGEDPKHTFNVGGLGVDAIRRIKLLTRNQLEHDLGFTFKKRNLLITFHPVTLEDSTSSQQMKELLSALSKLSDTQLIFTMPNADTDSRILFTMIEDFVRSNANSCVFTSLGQVRYFSCVSEVDGVIGNSSSGLLEVPSFKKATVNIGDRQKGRLKASSIIDCEPSAAEIGLAINTIYSPDFQRTLKLAENPYGDGGAVDKIMDTLKSMSFKGLIKKKFYDLPPQR
jgi:GDP/UDP-N,N'-diacetylbacillosamine 2-epimerase (hydrolysing)